ncbi:probable G-protein coupled receptor 34 isoform X3 [Hyla sarda]|uniref:probable G-protein coupled receptor 34 isoform X3 n=1 Tax=Hyla sarda TaxID=327740 RepID=UPI0024C22C1C|nr:probable G-protein coupled receptor 34 isoform X3 [Hyla sarda]
MSMSQYDRRHTEIMDFLTISTPSDVTTNTWTLETSGPLYLDLNVTSSPPFNGCDIKDGVLSWLLPVVYSFVCGLSLMSNILALFVFWTNSQRSTSMTVYMRNLAIADLLLALCLPFRIAYQNNNGPLLLCHVIGAFFYLNMYASIMFLSLISMDRYLKITRPLQQYKIHSVQWSSRAAHVVWVINVVCIVPFLFENKGNEPCGQKCFHFKKKGTVSAAINLTAVLAFFVLLFLFVYFYAQISAKLHRASLMKNQPQTKRNSNRAMKKSFVVLIIFIVCFVPYHLVRVPYVLAQINVIPSLSWKQTLHITNELVLCLSTLNSCLDPVIYFFLSDSFKRVVICTVQGKLKLIMNHQERASNGNRSVTEM